MRLLLGIYRQRCLPDTRITLPITPMLSQRLTERRSTQAQRLLGHLEHQQLIAAESLEQLKRTTEEP